jgi:hypothetical protein
MVPLPFHPAALLAAALSAPAMEPEVERPSAASRR